MSLGTHVYIKCEKCPAEFGYNMGFTHGTHRGLYDAAQGVGWVTLEVKGQDHMGNDTHVDLHFCPEHVLDYYPLAELLQPRETLRRAIDKAARLCEAWGNEPLVVCKDLAKILGFQDPTPPLEPGIGEDLQMNQFVMGDYAYQFDSAGHCMLLGTFWCNTHGRSHKICRGGAGGILLPCEPKIIPAVLEPCPLATK